MITLGVVALAIAALAPFSFDLKPAHEPKTRTDVFVEALASVQGPRFSSLLERWSAQHEARGGDRNIVVRLSPTASGPQHIPQGTPQQGVARLDAIEGELQVELPMQDSAERLEVWLVDQRPVEGAGTVAYEPTDAYIRAGDLQREGDRLTLDADLGSETFEAFQVDAVVVTRAGERPDSGSVYQGAPDLFQTLYTALRTPRLFAQSDFASPDAFPGREGPLVNANQAFAQQTLPPLDELRNFGVGEDERRQLLNVDADVLMDRMVERGARLFIQEEFDGNGRTCETCHNFLNNITIDRNDVRLRPDRDSLFVSEFMPDLAPRRVGGGMRFALDAPTAVREARPCITVDGFPALDGSPNDPEPVCRAVPHLQAFSLSRSPAVPAIFPQTLTDLMGNPLPGFGTIFDTDPAMVPAAGSRVGPLNSMVIGDAQGQLGLAIDGTFTVGFRAGFGGDLGVEPPLGLMGDDVAIVVGAVAELFTKSPARNPMGTDRDFRIPTPAEINAITAFYLTLGRQQEFAALQASFTDPQAERGRLIFLNTGSEMFNNGSPLTDPAGQPLAAGKCSICHFNMGSTNSPPVFNGVCGMVIQNIPPLAGTQVTCGGTQMNFETGTENNSSVADMMTRMAFGRGLPRDGGYGRLPQVDGVCNNGRGGRGSVAVIPGPPGSNINPGDCQETFSVPVLVEAADTGPFFHNNTATTIEDAIAFYASDIFAQSAGGRIIANATPTPNPNRPISLDSGSAAQLAAFFRATNAANNGLQALSFVQGARRPRVATEVQQQLLRVGRSEVQDAIEVLFGAQINQTSLMMLTDVRDLLNVQINTVPNDADLARIEQMLGDAVDGIVNRPFLNRR